MISVAISASAACTDTDTVVLTTGQAVAAFVLILALPLVFVLLPTGDGIHTKMAARRRAKFAAQVAVVRSGYLTELLPAELGVTAMVALTLEQFETAYTAASRGLDLALGRLAPEEGQVRLDPETSSGAAALAMRTRHLAALKHEMDRRNSSYYKDPDKHLRFQKFRSSTRVEALRRADFAAGRL